jgi:hypothetical protein
MRRHCSPRCAGFGLGIGITFFAHSCAPPLGALQSAMAGKTAGQSPAGSPIHAESRPAPVSAVTSGAEPLWWRLVPVHIDEPPVPGADAKPDFFTSHPLDLLIPAGWKLEGQVDWPLHKGNPSLAFRVDSPDGQIGLEYLAHDSWSWSDDPGTRTSLQAIGEKVQPLPTGAVDYLRTVLLPKLRPGAQVIAIEPLPTIAGYLNADLSGPNIAGEFDAKQNGVAAPKSSGDAARARITYLRNGMPVEEWIEIAVEHLQRHADNTPPWKPGETSREEVAPSGPMIDTFTVIECDILRAPQGTLERNSRILGTILGQLTQNDRWTEQVSYEYWHGKFNDRIIYFRSSYFGGDQFYFDGPSSQESYSFAYDHAWRNDSGGEVIVTDSADFDPNEKVGAQSWTRLKPRP